MRSPLPGTGRAACPFLIAALAICLGARAQADEGVPPAASEGRHYEAGLFVGPHFFSGSSSLGYNPDGPVGNSLKYTGTFGGRFSLGLIQHFGLEIELALMNASSQVTKGQVLVFSYGGHFIYDILGGRVRPFVLAGVNGQSAVPEAASLVLRDSAPYFHAGAGLKVDITEHFGARIDGRILLGPDLKTSLGTEDWEVLFGLYGRWGGTPPKPVVVDTDGDGIPDAEDKCPTQAGPKENGGCPDKDSDGDGIIDRLDKCPTQAGPKENEGCPDKDSDGDGIIDRLDKCPTLAGPKENGGCPDKDTDGDGIVDRLDKCPNEPETRNGYQDEDGCPDEVPKAVQQFTGAIQGITFQPNKAVILPSSFKVLDKAAAVLLEHDSVRLEISGHTDTSGKAEMNRKLSQARAEAVRQYLVNKGVAPERLTAMGYGPDKPVSPNTTAAGRAKNRRVEFQLVSGTTTTTVPVTPPTAPGATQAPATAGTPTAPATTAAPAGKTAPEPATPEAPARPAKKGPPVPPLR